MELVRPESVVDVGCGAGHFLAEFQRRGIADVIGVDFPGIASDLLRIPTTQFKGFDLAKPFSLERKFELVLSLEVAEHITPVSADIFVDTLVSLGPVVVFSAAIPLQGGYQHVNEQWPEYWAAKFRTRNYEVVDGLRDRLWRNDAVPSYYRQNSLIFVESEALQRYPRLVAESRRNQNHNLSRVHPSLYEERSDPRRVGVRFLMKALFYAPVTVFRSVVTQLKARFAP